MPGGALSKQTPASDKREAFIKEYLKTRNATLSAIQAGYSPRSAHVTGSRLLNDAKLKQRIEQYGQIGLDTLASISVTGKNEIARVQASKELVERAYGKARSNDADKQRVPSITINMNKIDITGVESKEVLSIDTEAGAVKTSQGK
jgi:ribosomal protein L34E